MESIELDPIAADTSHSPLVCPTRAKTDRHSLSRGPRDSVEESHFRTLCFGELLRVLANAFKALSLEPAIEILETVIGTHGDKVSHSPQ